MAVIEDVAPQLLDAITEDFQKGYKASEKIQLLLKKVQKKLNQV